MRHYPVCSCGKNCKEYRAKLCRECYLKSVGNFQYCLRCGKRISHRGKSGLCKGCVQLGKNNPNWIDGRDKDKYPLRFDSKLKARIRERDDYTCQRCGITEEQLKGNYFKKLDIHHIDYNKENLLDENLTCLCRSCNGQVNKNREYWKQYFRIKLGV